MKTDAYTKVVLTGIAIFLGFIAFDYKPSMKAEAGIMGSSEMIMPGNGGSIFHLREGKIRVCFLHAPTSLVDYEVRCNKWSAG